ncbi:MAG TPA: helix-turn-helix domain-containing protein [Erysipelothrix sp.]|nr:helix-turn-helix domain-containing protein [Erysipelothrix sp.]
MENISSQLKQARIEQGLTQDEAAQKTKFTIAQLKAIEEGNLDFFKHDLSYFRYIIRYYSDFLGYDYELIRKEVDAIVAQDEFTQELEKISKRVPVKTDKDDKPTKKRTLPRRKIKIDYSFLAFLFTSILLVIVLIYAGITYIPGLFKKDPIKEPEIVNRDETEDDDSEDEPEDDVEEEPKSTIEVSAVSTDPKQLEIKGWEENEEVEIKLVFKASATWISTSVNNVVLDDPVSKTYQQDEEIILVEKASENKEVLFHLGIMNGNEFYINDKRVELDESIQNSAGVVKLYFKFVKDGE